MSTYIAFFYSCLNVYTIWNIIFWKKTIIGILSLFFYGSFIANLKNNLQCCNIYEIGTIWSYREYTNPFAEVLPEAPCVKKSLVVSFFYKMKYRMDVHEQWDYIINFHGDVLCACKHVHMTWNICVYSIFIL